MLSTSYTICRGGGKEGVKRYKEQQQQKLLFFRFARKAKPWGAAPHPAGGFAAPSPPHWQTLATAGSEKKKKPSISPALFLGWVFSVIVLSRSRTRDPQTTPCWIFWHLGGGMSKQKKNVP